MILKLPQITVDAAQGVCGFTIRESDGSEHGNTDTCIATVYQDHAAEYIAHACNAYPKLVEALRELMLRCDGPQGMRADGSNVQTMRASAVLSELGEM
jgi:hypothetical protein